MPVYLMFGLVLAVITGWIILGHVLLYGTKRDMFWLFVYAWLVFFVLWWWKL
jgi:hypothetical protein